MKVTFLESSWEELSEHKIFTDFGHIFQTLWQYECDLTTFWYGLFPNMVISRDSG